MSLPVPGSTPIGGPTFRSIGRTSLCPATNMYPALTVSPPPSGRSIARLVCSVYGERKLRSTEVPPCTNNGLFGKDPLLIRFSKAAVSSGGGTVPGGSGPGGTTGQPGITQGVGRNMLLSSHVPVIWFLAKGNPVIIGWRCGAGTKKKVRLYLSLNIP